MRRMRAAPRGADDGGGSGRALTPRSGYSAKKRRAETLTMELMMNLDAHTIASIKKEFVENGGEVDIYEFVRIMRTYLPEHLEVRAEGKDDEGDRQADGGADAAAPAPASRSLWGASATPSRRHGRGGGGGSSSRRGGSSRGGRGAGGRGSGASGGGGGGGGRRNDGPTQRVTEMQLVANLTELFKEIDVNGDAMMEWDEFTSFIVDKAVVFRDDASVDAIAGYHSVYIPPAADDRGGVRGRRAKRPNLKAKLKELMERGEADDKRRGGGRGGSSAKKRPPQFHNEVIEGLKFVPRLNQLAVLEQRNPVVKMYDCRTLRLEGELVGHDGIPEAVEYIETPSSYLISSCADSTMALWDLNPGSSQYSYITCWPTPHVQMSLAWSSQYTTLYSGSTTGLVHSWDIKAREETGCMAGHSDIVMDVITIPQLDNVVSASLDSTVCMWDMCTGAQRQCLKGHSKGVLSLAYCPDHRFLISSGFDHDALVWSPFVPSLLYKLKGHSTPLLGVRAVPNKPEVITASVDGQFKVWDLRSFKCVQTFSDETAGMQNVAAFEHCPPLRRIVSATKKLSAFDQGGERQVTKVSDELPVTTALFNATSMTVLTASARTVKIWNALTGTLLRVYRDVTETDITAVCLDDRQRKFIAGEASGAVRVYNYANGAVMKSMVSHTREVSSLLYCNELKVVVSCSWDRTIVVHDEMDPEKGVVLRMMDQMRAHKADVSCADWNHAVSLVATGSSDKTVRLWDLETGKLEALLPHPAEVVTVQFLAPLPYILSADSSGNLFLWGVRGSACKHVLAAAWSLNPAGFWPSRLAARNAAVDEVRDAARRKAAEDRQRREKERASARKARAKARRARVAAESSGGAGGAAAAARDGERKGAGGTGDDSKGQDNDGSDGWAADGSELDEEKAGGEGEADEAAELAAARRLAGAAPTAGSRHASALEGMRHTFEASYAACAAWDAETRLLYTGDERGQLSCWQLGALLDVINNEDIKPGNVHCQPDVDARAADSTLSSLYDGPNLVTLDWITRGHTDAVTSIQVVQRPPSILTSSYDRCVHMWDQEGKNVGLLCRAVRSGRNPYWHLPVDVAAREAEETEATAATLAVLAKRAAERHGAQAKSDRRARAAAKARARERAAAQANGNRAAAAAASKVGTGFWAAEAEASRHRTRQRKDKEAAEMAAAGVDAGMSVLQSRQQRLQGAAGGSMASFADAMPSSRPSARGRSNGANGASAAAARRKHHMSFGADLAAVRKNPSKLRPEVLAKLAPKQSPLDATRAEWAGTEMPSRETRKRVANALSSMTSNMVGRRSSRQVGGRGPEGIAMGLASDTHATPHHVPTVADQEILQSLTESYHPMRSSGGGSIAGGASRSIAGGADRVGAGGGRASNVGLRGSRSSDGGGGSIAGGGRRRIGSLELRNAGAASIHSSPSSAQSSARSVSQFNSKTIEAAARLGAILSDLT